MGSDPSEMSLRKQPRPAEVQAEDKENLEWVMRCGECRISIVTPIIVGAMFPSIHLPLSLPEKVVTRILEVLFPGRVTFICEASSWSHAKGILLWCYGEPPRSCLWDQEAYLQVSRSVSCQWLIAESLLGHFQKELPYLTSWALPKVNLPGQCEGSKVQPSCLSWSQLWRIIPTPEVPVETSFVVTASQISFLL